MPDRIEAKLAKLGLELPPTAALPHGVVLSYRRLVRHGDVAYLSGHLPYHGDELRYTGRVGAEVTLKDAAAAARQTALSMLRTIKDELGGLDAVERWLQVTGYVRAVPGFTQQPVVINGFTDLVRSLWGADRLGARSAIGVADLPFGTPVEVEATVVVRGA
ncbi:MAG TPA: RidA family protein [Candidatus Dormibacteraeota bacterium]|nr:RidA family protein [Candidatus Dormibacteraeota bacterium]